jgi:PAS domain S-box-containing protein
MRSAMLHHTNVEARGPLARVRPGRPLRSRLAHVDAQFADAIPIPVWIITPEGRVSYGNARWLAIVGIGRDGSQRARWTDAFHPHDRTRAENVLRNAVAKRQPFEVEVRVHSGGAYHWSACIGGPRFSAAGRLQDYVGLCCDTSVKRETELALTDLASKVVNAQEEERRRIGSELHDDLGQQAALLAAKFDTVVHGGSMPARQLRAGMAEIRRNVQDLAVAIHNLSHQLHPARLRLLGLEKTLEVLCRELSTQSRVHVRFHAHGVPPCVPESIALCAFRVTQEALQNALKHSGAGEIDVALAGSGSHLTLRVRDNGRGFAPVTADTHGIGLLTMRERVVISGGTLRVESANPSGTTIEATLPLEHDDVR